MAGKYKTFSPEFREEAARMVVETSRPIAEVARVLREGASVSDKYEFIDAEYADRLAEGGGNAPAITYMCGWLGVSKSGFYEWRSRPESVTAKRQRQLGLIINPDHSCGLGLAQPHWADCLVDLHFTVAV